MAFAAVLGGYVVASSIGTSGWIVCVRSINSDVSAGPKPRGVVS